MDTIWQHFHTASIWQHHNSRHATGHEISTLTSSRAGDGRPCGFADGSSGRQLFYIVKGIELPSLWRWLVECQDLPPNDCYKILTELLILKALASQMVKWCICAYFIPSEYTITQYMLKFAVTSIFNRILWSEWHHAVWFHSSTFFYIYYYFIVEFIQIFKVNVIERPKILSDITMVWNRMPHFF